VFSLEHMPEWQSRVNQTLRSLGLPNRVALAELRSYGEFDWYDLPPDLSSGIGLVICDGPPSITRGGRYGLLPVCMEHFAPNCTILLDDAEREDERAILSAWQSRFGLSVEIKQGTQGAFAWCRYQGSGLQEIPAAGSMAATARDGT
jgi:hypothetical protein